jgi:hypothetical protein
VSNSGAESSQSDIPTVGASAPAEAAGSTPVRFWPLAIASVVIALVATYIALTSHHWVALVLGAVVIVLASLAGRHPRWGNRWSMVPALLVVISGFAIIVT